LAGLSSEAAVESSILPGICIKQPRKALLSDERASPAAFHASDGAPKSRGNIRDIHAVRLSAGPR
jgi:hypothetical protein